MHRHGADTALNAQPAASPGRWAQFFEMYYYQRFLLLLFVFSACNSRKESSNSNALEIPPINNDSTSKGLVFRNKFFNADTVSLIEHWSIGYKEENGKTSVAPSTVIIKGEPTHIIRIKQLMSKAELDTLVNILARPIIEDEGRSMCLFDPHYSIIVTKNGLSSYVTMCFHCGQFEASPDLQSLLQFDHKKWKALKSFFKTEGFDFKNY